MRTLNGALDLKMVAAVARIVRPAVSNAGSRRKIADAICFMVTNAEAIHTTTRNNERDCPHSNTDTGALFFWIA
jgi:hypothetical protein